MKKLLAIFTVVLVAAAGYFAYEFERQRNSLHQPLAFDGDTLRVDVEPGATLAQITRRLHADGVMPFPRALVWHARYYKLASQIKAGEYALAPGTTPLQLLDVLVSGKVVQWSFAIIEGWTFRDLREKLEEDDNLVITLTDVPDEEVMSLLGHPEVHPEGWFMPDTYLFPRGTTDLEFLRRALNATKQYLDTEWPNRDPDLPLIKPYEALILASIVEKETGVARERPEIAGVFVRRLKKGMKLQADPTVIYGLGDEFKGNITRKHLETPTPYNTYTRRGLPPTPIALAGKAAIHAVLHPAEGDDLFFVAKGDGTHYFSATYAEHKKAVKKFQIDPHRNN